MRKKKQQERRPQILWAAIETVAECGIEGSTLKAIAQRAGVSTGMITYYFKDKNDLMESALAFGHQMVGERSRELRSAGDDHLSALYEVSLVTEAPAVPPLPFWIEYWAHATRDAELKEFRAARISRFRQNIALTVRQEMDAGAFRPGLDPLLTADLLQALLDGLQLKIALDSETISSARAIEVFELLRTLLGAQVVHPESPPAAIPDSSGAENGHHAR